jgi:hypothetical protein
VLDATWLRDVQNVEHTKFQNRKVVVRDQGGLAPGEHARVVFNYIEVSNLSANRVFGSPIRRIMTKSVKESIKESEAWHPLIGKWHQSFIWCWLVFNCLNKRLRCFISLPFGER